MLLRRSSAFFFLLLFFVSRLFAISDHKDNSIECWIGLDVTSADTVYAGQKALIIAKAHFKLSQSPAFDSLIVEPILPFSEGWENKVVKRGGEFFLNDTLILFPKKKDVGEYTLLFRASTSKNPKDTRIKKIHFSVIYSFHFPQILSEPKFTPDLSNTIYWIPAKNAVHQYAVCFNPSFPGLEMRVNRLSKLARTDTMSTTFENLQNGTRYGYFIRAIFNDEGKQIIVNSDTTYSTQDNTPPFDVTTAKVKPNPDGVVVVSWESVADAISYVRSYYIFRRKMNGEFRLIDTLTVEYPAKKMVYSYEESLSGSTGLIEGEQYSYKIVAVDAVGNQSGGNETKFVIPDKTPPPDPRFVWKKGNGYDYFDPFTHKYFARGCSEKITLVNSFQVSNPNFITQPDSVRFQASIDKIDFLGKEEELPGFAFSTAWLPIDSLSHIFDYCNLKNTYQIEVDGHPTFYRAQFKDKSGNLSQWSYVDQQNQTISVVMDNAAPGDVHNLTATAQVNASFTDGTITVKWGAATEAGSGLDNYIVYRKIDNAASFDSIGSVKISIAKPMYSYEDSFSKIDTSTTVYYRIGSQDHVGNLRGADLTQQEASTRCLLGPIIHLDSAVVVDDTLMTNRNYGIVSWKGFDEAGVIEMAILVDHNNQTLKYTQKRADLDTTHIKLPEDGGYSIRAQATFRNPDIKSTWSNTVRLYKKTTTPPSVNDLVVTNVDSCSAGGNLYLKWHKPVQNDWNYCYQIWRKEEGKSYWDSLKNQSCSPDDQISYTDSAKSVLKTFSFYYYKLRAIDPLGNISEFSNIDSSYCNRPPTLIKAAPDTNTGIITVFWKESWPSNVHKYKFLVEIDSLGTNGKWQFLKTEVVIDTTLYSNHGFSRGSIYRFRVKEIPYIQNRWRDNLSTAWSYPLVVPFGKIPPNVNLEVQALPSWPGEPDKGKIFLHWSWHVGTSNTVPNSFQIYRGKKGDNLLKIATVAAPRDTFTDGLLSVRTDYYYKVISMDKYGTHSKNDTIKRASIDPIWMFTPYMKDTSFVYFRDSLTVRWGWKDRGGHDVNTTYGAILCQIQLSANKDFSVPDTVSGWIDSHPKKYQFKKPFWVSNSAPIVYVRIRAKDKFGHISPWSTTYFKEQKYVYDGIPPYPVDSLKIYSVRARKDVKDSNYVDVFLGWKRVKDIGSGIYEYRIFRNGDLIVSIPASLSNFIDERVPVKGLSSSYWFIHSVDSVGNERVDCDTAHVELVVPAPKNLHAQNLWSCCWDPVTISDTSLTVEYLLQEANKKEFFEIDTLTGKGTWTKDTCDTIAGWIPDNPTYFRAKARVLYFESPWSEVLPYDTTKSSGNELLFVNNQDSHLPRHFDLQQNYPNPFNINTIISYQLPKPARVTLEIYNLLGKRILTLVNAIKKAGYYHVVWNGKDNNGSTVVSGIYIYSIYIRSDKKTIHYTKKLILIK